MDMKLIAVGIAAYLLLSRKPNKNIDLSEATLPVSERVKRDKQKPPSRVSLSLASRPSPLARTFQVGDVVKLATKSPYEIFVVEIKKAVGDDYDGLIVTPPRKQPATKGAMLYFDHGDIVAPA